MISDDTVVNITLNDAVPAGGAYANGVLVWNTSHEFTVDFTSQRGPTSSGEALDVLIVARVKIPASAMFQIVRTMSANIGRYEHQHGRITPRPPKDAP